MSSLRDIMSQQSFDEYHHEPAGDPVPDTWDDWDSKQVFAADG